MNTQIRSGISVSAYIAFLSWSVALREDHAVYSKIIRFGLLWNFPFLFILLWCENIFQPPKSRESWNSFRMPLPTSEAPPFTTATYWTYILNSALLIVAQHIFLHLLLWHTYQKPSSRSNHNQRRHSIRSLIFKASFITAVAQYSIVWLVCVKTDSAQPMWERQCQISQDRNL